MNLTIAYVDKRGRSKTYRAWESMKQRCTNPRFSSYSYYGGRGIEICERWLSYQNFLLDMGEVPIGFTLERRNNNGNYEPLNCYWATRKQQARNRRTSALITLMGETKPVSQWAEELGLNAKSVFTRLYAGRTPEEALRL